jgi:SM-20-related protein
MPMPSVVETWIQPQHLDSGTMHGYRQAFASHPARLLVLRDFLLEERASTLHTFLVENAEYEVKYGLYSDPDRGVDREAWLAAPEPDRFFQFAQLKGIRPAAVLSRPTLTYMQFRAAFADPAFRAFFEAVTGLELRHDREDIGVHAMRAGDFLRSHDDDNRDRKLAMVLYLTPGWRPEFGGTLNVVEPDGTVTEIVADYNSLVMFDVESGATHHVTTVTDAAGEAARRTIGGWYHKAT